LHEQALHSEAHEEQYLEYVVEFGESTIEIKLHIVDSILRSHKSFLLKGNENDLKMFNLKASPIYLNSTHQSWRAGEGLRGQGTSVDLTQPLSGLKAFCSVDPG
jgi:hypothetical protein